MVSKVPTYYDVLQVDRDSTPEGVRRAWRRMAQKYHPDKMPGNANAARAMAAINAAYEVLSDPHQRALHDQWIGKSEAPPAKRSRAQSAEAPGGWAAFNPAHHWPWYLLFATMSFAVATVGTAVYLTATPVLMTAAKHTAKAAPNKGARHAPGQSPESPER